jgi:hypothetical protein
MSAKALLNADYADNNMKRKTTNATQKALDARKGKDVNTPP